MHRTLEDHAMPHRRLSEIVAGQKLVSVSPTDTAREAAREMQRRHIGAALVMDGDRLLGIFTWSNLLDRVLDAGLDPKVTPVGVIMSSEPICLGCDCEGFEAVRMMRENKVRHIVVTLKDGGYGIVSVKDFPNEEIEEFEDELSLEQRIWERI